MNQSGFQFNSAPGSSSGIRSAAQTVASVLGLTAGKKSKAGADGMSVADKKALIEHQAHADVYKEASKAAFSGLESEKARKAASRESRAGRKHAASESALAASRGKEAQTHAFDTLSNAATNPNFKSISLGGGASAAFHPQKKGKQMEGVGTTESPATPPVTLY